MLSSMHLIKGIIQVTISMFTEYFINMCASSTNTSSYSSRAVSGGWWWTNMDVDFVSEPQLKKKKEPESSAFFNGLSYLNA